MKTLIRKFGTSEYVEIEHEHDDCPICQSAMRVQWNCPGQVIYFETSAGNVHRVEFDQFPETSTFAGMNCIDCRETSAEQARAEIAAAAEN